MRRSFRPEIPLILPQFSSQISILFLAVGTADATLQDDDGSQSPILWNNTLNCDSISVLPSLPSNVQIGEYTSEPMYSCPVAGCGHRYTILSQLAVHYHDHFVNPDGGRAVIFHFFIPSFFLFSCFCE